MQASIVDNKGCEVIGPVAFVVCEPKTIAFVGSRGAPVQNKGDSGGCGRLTLGHHYPLKQSFIPAIILLFTIKACSEEASMIG